MEEELKESLISKTQIKKLGKTIRKEKSTGLDISEASLLKLQNYRTTYQRDISEVFNKLSEVSRRIRKDRVVTFRIKRIESILSKLTREPTMQLDTMGDIAGCRCIVHSDAAVMKIVKLLEKKFTIKRRKNYLANPKEDGYKAYHIYVESPFDPDKQIEIQVRSQESHNWATLVEIIDVLYDKKIKEGEQEPALKEFLLLMSQQSSLNYAKKDKIIEVEEQYKIYSNLSSLFSKNYLIIRNAWFKLESKPDHTYFVIAVNEDKTPTIKSYKEYDEAESVYFQTFSDFKNSNVVLTHLNEVEFSKLCIAYSNYILIKHGFLDEWQRIMLDQIKTDYLQGNRKKANDLVDRFKKTIREEHDHIQLEMDALKNIIRNKTEEHSDSESSKLFEWFVELEERSNRGRETSNELDVLIKKFGRSRMAQLFD